jgi:F-type H+-transporting ATPase subunit b
LPKPRPASSSQTCQSPGGGNWLGRAIAGQEASSASARQALAQERIAQEEAKAVAEIRAIAVDVAISAARQVITASLDEKRGAKLIDNAIAELPRQLRPR